jgi:hypothetical protein
MKKLHILNRHQRISSLDCLTYSHSMNALSAETLALTRTTRPVTTLSPCAAKEVGRTHRHHAGGAQASCGQGTLPQAVVF